MEIAEVIMVDEPGASVSYGHILISSHLPFLFPSIVKVAKHV